MSSAHAVGVMEPFAPWTLAAAWGRIDAIDVVFQKYSSSSSNGNLTVGVNASNNLVILGLVSQSERSMDRSVDSWL